MLYLAKSTLAVICRVVSKVGKYSFLQIKKNRSIICFQNKTRCERKKIQMPINVMEISEKFILPLEEPR